MGPPVSMRGQFQTYILTCDRGVRPRESHARYQKAKWIILLLSVFKRSELVASGSGTNPECLKDYSKMNTENKRITCKN